jgi:Ca2+-binding EF-hand superfamily protein
MAETLEGATFGKYDAGGKGYLTKEQVAIMMVALGYEVPDEYINGLLDIYGSVDPFSDTWQVNRVLKLDGFNALSQHLGGEGTTESLEDVTLHKYDTGGKGHLTAGEVSSLLADLEYDVDGEYISGLLEVYVDEEGVLGLDGFKVRLELGISGIFGPVLGCLTRCLSTASPNPLAGAHAAPCRRGSRRARRSSATEEGDGRGVLGAFVGARAHIRRGTAEAHHGGVCGAGRARHRLGEPRAGAPPAPPESRFWARGHTLHTNFYSKTYPDPTAVDTR